MLSFEFYIKSSLILEKYPKTQNSKLRTENFIRSIGDCSAESKFDSL